MALLRIDRNAYLTGFSQGKKKRQSGIDAVKSHIVAAKTVANLVKTSLVWMSNVVILF